MIYKLRETWYWFSSNGYKSNDIAALFYMCNTYRGLYNILWSDKIPTKTAMKNAIDIIYTLNV